MVGLLECNKPGLSDRSIVYPHSCTVVYATIALMISALSSKPCAISVRAEAIVLCQLMAGADAKTLVVHSRIVPLFIPAGVISDFSLPSTESGKHPEVFVLLEVLFVTHSKCNFERRKVPLKMSWKVRLKISYQ